MYYSPSGDFEYRGLWYIPDENDESITYESGEQGYIRICFKHKNVRGLTIKVDDKTLLKNKGKSLYDFANAGKDNAVTISLYDAWPILFS